MILNFIVIGGSFGGICAYLSFSIHDGANGFKDKLGTSFGWWLACLLANAAIGVCGALAIQVLVLGMRFYEKADGTQASDDVFLAAICVVGGFGARSFLPRLTQMFERQIEQAQKKADTAINAVKQVKEEVKVQFHAQDDRVRLIAQFEAAVHDGATSEDLNFVVESARRELTKTPLDASFVLPLGRALRRLGQLREAIDELTKYVDRRGAVKGKDRDLSYVLYNRACYYCLLNDKQPDAANVTHAISDLERSLRLSEDNEADKLYTRNDDDFASLRKIKRFQELVEVKDAV